MTVEGDNPAPMGGVFHVHGTKSALNYGGCCGNILSVVRDCRNQDKASGGCGGVIAALVGRLSRRPNPRPMTIIGVRSLCETNRLRPRSDNRTFFQANDGDATNGSQFVFYSVAHHPPCRYPKTRPVASLCDLTAIRIVDLVATLPATGRHATPSNAWMPFADARSAGQGRPAQEPSHALRGVQAAP